MSNVKGRVETRPRKRYCLTVYSVSLKFFNIAMVTIPGYCLANGPRGLMAGPRGLMAGPHDLCLCRMGGPPCPRS